MLDRLRSDAVARFAGAERSKNRATASLLEVQSNEPLRFLIHSAWEPG